MVQHGVTKLWHNQPQTYSKYHKCVQTAAEICNVLFHTCYYFTNNKCEITICKFLLQPVMTVRIALRNTKKRNNQDNYHIREIWCNLRKHLIFDSSCLECKGGEWAELEKKCTSNSGTAFPSLVQFQVCWDFIFNQHNWPCWPLVLRTEVVTDLETHHYGANYTVNCIVTVGIPNLFLKNCKYFFSIFSFFF